MNFEEFINSHKDNPIYKKWENVLIFFTDKKQFSKIITENKMSTTDILEFLSVCHLQYNYPLYYELPEFKKMDSELILYFSNINPEIVKDLPLSCFKDKRYCIEMMKKNNKTYIFFPLELKNDKNISMEYLKTPGAIWSNVPIELIDFFFDSPVIVNSLLNNIDIYRFLQDELKNDYSNSSKAVRLNYDNLKFIKDEQIKKNIILEHINGAKDYALDAKLKSVVLGEYLNNTEMMCHLIKKDHFVYSLLKTEQKCDWEIIKSLLEKGKNNLTPYSYLDLIDIKALKNAETLYKIIDLLAINYPNGKIGSSFNPRFVQCIIDKKLIYPENYENLKDMIDFQSLKSLVDKKLFHSDTKKASVKKTPRKF